MKVSKIIIPFLGLTSINNANKQELLQTEKLPEISYEVSTIDNWDNYYYLTNTDIVKNQSEIIQSNSQKNEIIEGSPVQFHTAQECWEILQGALATCALLGPFSEPCIAVALAAYATCMACSC